MRNKLWKSLGLILILSMITISTQTKRAYAQDPTISIFPDPNTYEVGSDFWVSLLIVDVAAPGAALWQVTLKFDPSVLTVENILSDVVEGGWLSQDGYYMTSFQATSTPLGIVIACYISEPGATEGEGELAAVRLKVIGPGKSSINLVNTSLRDEDQVLIPHNIQPGSFYTDQPKADFSYTFKDMDLRDSPVVGETISFNATRDELSNTGSYDPNPGGEITKYTWNFGDGTVIRYVKDINLTAVTSHSYATKGDYSANLTVTDNATPGLTHTLIRPVHVAQHDLAITRLRITPAVAEPGTLVRVNVTVMNLGYESEYFNLTLYYDSTPIYYNVTPGYLQKTAFCLAVENGSDPRPPGIALLPGQSMMVNFTWITTGVPEAAYTLRANLSLTPTNPAIFDRFMEGVEVNYANNQMNRTAIITSEPINIAITDMTVSPKVIAVGQGPTSIGVVIENEGNTDQTFSVSVFYNSTLIENRTDINLGPKANTTQIFTWDTTGLLNGTYIISANASLVLGEMIPDDNTFTYPDGIIISHAPTASFTYTPDTPRVGDPVSFDASGSSDSDGTIDNYIWNFGDGTTLSFGKIVSHTYLLAGTFDVNLTVTDNVGLKTSLIMQVIVDKAVSTISLSISPTTLTFGSQVATNGVITPPRDQVDVTIMFRVQGEQAWNNLATVKTNATGHYSSSWKPPAAKTYQVQTNWSGDLNTHASFSAIVDVTVNKAISEITSSANPKTVTVGSSVTIVGTITPARTGVTVTIQARLVGGTESTIGTATTDSAGAYSFAWTPDEAGTFEVRAIWNGDDNTIGDQSAWETVTINEAQQPIPIYYIVGGIAIVAIIIVAVVYFFKIRKP